MDPASCDFKACFIGIGEKGQEIGQCVNKDFEELIKYFQKYREDDPDEFAGNETPQLTVISLNPYESVEKLPDQWMIFLLGSQNDQTFLEIRNKIISLNKHYVLLFTLVLSSKGVINDDIQANKKESLIYLDEGSEEQVVTFVKDMCRFGIFPVLLSCDMADVRTVLSNNRGKIITYESLHDDHIEPFKQFIADKSEVLKRATGIFFLVSSNLDSFSLKNHYNPIISTIQDAMNDNCDSVGSDSFYAEKDYALRVNIICAENSQKDPSV